MMLSSAFTSCAPGAETEAEAVSTAVINGMPETIEQSGHVFMTIYRNQWGRLWVCSGELIRNRWVLTAKHCVEEEDHTDISGFRADVVMGTQERTSIQVIRHPNADVALIELDQPMVMPGQLGYLFARPLNAFGQSGPMQIFGYGGIDTGLKSGQVVASGESTPVEVDGTSSGQGIQGGDSGGGLFLMWPVQTLVGIASYREQTGFKSYFESVRQIRNWAYELIYPGQPFVCHGTECFTAAESLPPNLTTGATWDPCPGRPFRLEGELELQSGDTLSLRDTLGTDLLSGNTRLMRETSGLVFLTLRTDATITSRGIRSLRAKCR
jgi:hypothetical protein